MTQRAESLSVELRDKKICVDRIFYISFRRTIRVPDNEQVSQLPPNLGAFPLKRISEYTEKLGGAMAAKGGVFFPMHCMYYPIPSLYPASNIRTESEAMWIRFNLSEYAQYSRLKYMIKIYVDDVNAISDEHCHEDAATKLCRQKKIGAAQKTGETKQMFSRTTLLCQGRGSSMVLLTMMAPFVSLSQCPLAAVTLLNTK
ncbi:hypothetical protein GQ44DRAFT_730725 [Phaeosphaeriaceae sp. PMI808]|nr:hypothetical protein GQ44DRAFT_730725 [Phaeosphaeriaceae sp. PMI808]